MLMGTSFRQQHLISFSMKSEDCRTKGNRRTRIIFISCNVRMTRVLPLEAIETGTTLYTENECRRAKENAYTELHRELVMITLYADLLAR